MNANKFFEIKQSATLPKTVELYIYSDVCADSYDWWTDQKIVSETSANYFRDTLAAAGEVTQINIYINSLGGSVMQGVAIYNILRRHSAHKTVYIDGFACSVASVIAMAGDEVIMPANTNLMIHNPWTYAAGNATQLRKAAEDLDVLTESSRQAYLKKAKGKIAEEKLAELMDAETYLTAAQCIEYGLADRYADADIDIDAALEKLEAGGNGGGNAKEKAAAERYKQTVERLKQARKDIVTPIQADKPAEQKAPKQEEPEQEETQPAQIPAAEEKKTEEDFTAKAAEIINNFFKRKGE